MIKGLFSIAAALGLAALLLAPAVGAPKGFGSHHFARHNAVKRSLLRHRGGAFGYGDAFGYQGYGDALGGYSYDVPDYDVEAISEVSYPPLRIDPQIPPPAGLSCRRTRETVTVPAENGGIRQVTITRC